MRTAQEIFDEVATHLLKQNAKSAIKKNGFWDNQQCLYRSPNGLRCAIGKLIADEEYSPKLEGMTITNLIEETSLNAELRLELLKYNSLVQSLQRIHDEYSVIQWKLELQRIATFHNLQFNVGDK